MIFLLIKILIYQDIIAAYIISNNILFIGNPSNIPFWPGGFEEPKIPKNEDMDDIDFEKDLRTLAKGFSSGLEFKSDNCTDRKSVV